jgi:hypothetical protein
MRTRLNVPVPAGGTARMCQRCCAPVSSSTSPTVCARTLAFAHSACRAGMCKSRGAHQECPPQRCQRVLTACPCTARSISSRQPPSWAGPARATVATKKRLVVRAVKLSRAVSRHQAAAPQGKQTQRVHALTAPPDVCGTASAIAGCALFVQRCAQMHDAWPREKRTRPRHHDSQRTTGGARPARQRGTIPGERGWGRVPYLSESSALYADAQSSLICNYSRAESVSALASRS